MTESTVRTRIVEAAAGLLADAADVDISTRAACEAAGVTAPTLYHHFGDKQGLLAAVVDFGWAAFLETKRTVAAVEHEHVADDIRAGWDNHLEFARENPNFYKLMWSPGIGGNSSSFQSSYEMLRERMELGASRGQLRVSAERAAQMVMAATTGAALSAISRPELFGDDGFNAQLREAVIAAVTVADPSLMGTHRLVEAGESTAAAAAATLKSRLTVEGSPLSTPEQQLMQQWLTAIADGDPRSKP